MPYVETTPLKVILATRSPLRTIAKLMFAEPGSPMEAFAMALSRDAGDSWDAMLRKAGFDVWQVL